MTVFDRFNTILARVDITLACSLPIYNDGKEILFFYMTEPNTNNSYTITGIKRVFSRRTDNGFIEELGINSFLYESIQKCTGLMIYPKVFGSDAELIEDTYLALYESILHSITTNLPLENTLCKEFLASFELLVPSPQLQAVYYEFGRDLFNLVKMAL